MYAEVIVNRNSRDLNKVFDYIVPKEMENYIKLGSRVFVPFGKSSKLEDGFIINLKQTSEFAIKEIAKIQIEESLSEDKIILAQLMARKYFCNISDCIKLMLPPGTGSKELSNRAKEKKGNFVFLKKDIEEINCLIEEGKIKSEKHIRALKFLEQNDGIYISDLEILADVSKAILKTLEKKEYIEFVEKTIERNPFLNKNIEKDEPKILNEEQKQCFDAINFCIESNEFSKHLIYGITGSGKTEIYLQLIRKSFRKK